jgi:hypothetical protein
MNVFEQARNSGENVYEVTVRMRKPRGERIMGFIIAKTDAEAIRKMLRRTVFRQNGRNIASASVRECRASEWL